jgi:hypothetical protein
VHGMIEPQTPRNARSGCATRIIPEFGGIC